MRKLKPFGEDSMGSKHGYTLPFLVNWIRGLADDEAQRECSMHGPYAQRLAKVEDALAILEPIAEEEE